MRVVCSFLFIICSLANAADSLVRLERFQPLNGDYEKSVIKGGEFFAARCMSCHSLKLFTHDKIGRMSGVVINEMPSFEDISWEGNPPPDLSLVSKYRGNDWVYTYLLSFYDDNGKSNNLLIPNTSMPNPYIDMQGRHVLVGSGDNKSPWYRVLKQVDSGSITSNQFNDSVTALVMFLDYVAEPRKQERLDLAPWVLTFIAVFFSIAFLLYKSYWQDID